MLDLRIRKAVAHKGATLIAVGDHAPRSGVRGVRAATFAEAVKLRSRERPSASRCVWDGAPSAEGEAVVAWAESAARGHDLHTYIARRTAERARRRSDRHAPARRRPPEPRRCSKRRATANSASLALLGVNPVLHWPDRELAIDALKATPFVVVSDLFMTETAELATLVLPACSAFEKSGTTTNLAGDVLPVVAGVPAPGEAWADGDMLVALAEALGGRAALAR